jgi:hypothetical protein
MRPTQTLAQLFRRPAAPRAEESPDALATVAHADLPDGCMGCGACGRHLIAIDKAPKRTAKDS